MSLIISIDPGINKTGFAVLEAMGRQIRTLAYGTIEPPNKNYTPDRLKFLNSELSKIFIVYLFNKKFFQNSKI